MTDLFDLAGKVALVTGATRGIGLMMARGLASAGVRTYVCSRKPEACAAAEAELRAFGEVIGVPADLSDMTQLDALADAIKAREERVHILVNNAGAAWGERFDAFPESGWDKVMTLNVKAAFFLVQRLAPLLRAAGSAEDPARVVNVGSIDGLTVPMRETYSYSASKAALHHLTRHLARNLAPQHINVNAIAPGLFETRMTAQMIRDGGEALIERIPRRRPGRYEDIAGTLLYLCSTASAYVTGAIIPVDGGSSTTR